MALFLPVVSGTLTDKEREVGSVELIKIAVVLALLVYLARKHYQIGHVLFITALVFGILHQLTPLKLGSLIFTALLSPSALLVFTALFLISILENIMRLSGLQIRMVTGFKNLSGDPRIAMASLPAIIGLLSSPGGARFSAPMVEEASRELDCTAEHKAAINFYYRHVWDYFMPLFPTTLLAVEILEIPIQQFFVVMFPFTIVTMLAGLFMFRGITLINPEKQSVAPAKSWRDAMEGFTPFIVIMLLVLIFDLHILLSLFLVVTVMFFFYKIPTKELPTIFKNALSPRLFYMVFGALYMREILMGTGSIELLMNYFNDLGFGPLLISTILPFSIGLFTGQVVPGITIVFPFIVTIAGPDNILSLGSLAFVTNFVGNMLSPLHLCYILSIEHFNADFARTYRKLLLPEAIILLFAGAYSYLL